MGKGFLNLISNPLQTALPIRLFEPRQKMVLCICLDTAGPARIPHSHRSRHNKKSSSKQLDHCSFLLGSTLPAAWTHQKTWEVCQLIDGLKIYIFSPLECTWPCLVRSSPLNVLACHARVVWLSWTSPPAPIGAPQRDHGCVSFRHGRLWPLTNLARSLARSYHYLAASPQSS